MPRNNRELTLEESDGLFDLLHSNDLRSVSQARVLADALEVRDHPDYVDMVMSGFEEYFTTDDFNNLFKRATSDGDVETTGDFEIERNGVTLEFIFFPDDYVDERDSDKVGKDIAKKIAAILKKKLGVNARFAGTSWSENDSHDHDGFRPLPGQEWLEIKIWLEFPLEELL